MTREWPSIATHLRASSLHMCVRTLDRIPYCGINLRLPTSQEVRVATASHPSNATHKTHRRTATNFGFEDAECNREIFAPRFV